MVRVSGWSGPRMRILSVRSCTFRVMASSRRPADSYAYARLLREVRVSGWSSPRTRIRSVRSCTFRVMASVRRPAAWYALAMASAPCMCSRSEVIVLSAASASSKCQDAANQRTSMSLLSGD